MAQVFGVRHHKHKRVLFVQKRITHKSITKHREEKKKKTSQTQHKTKIQQRNSYEKKKKIPTFAAI